MSARDTSRTAFAMISKAITVVGSVVSLYVGLTNVINGSEAITRSTADDFVSLYAAVAVGNPDYAQENFTTPEFQDSKRGRQPEYRNFWSTVDEVTDATVKKSANGDKNYFDVTYTIKYRNGKTEDVASTWGLVCNNRVRKYNPWANCRAEDLRLDDVVRAAAVGK